MELSEQLKQKIVAYTPPLARITAIRSVPILLTVGITGAGKNSVQKRLIQEYPGQYHFIVSHTTRAPRHNNGVVEQDGVDYHFVDFKAVERMVDAGDFVEAKVVHVDNVYGTSVAEIETAGKERMIAVTDIEVQGVAEYVELGMHVKPIFLLPPDYDEWWHRLEGRYGGNLRREDMRKRMQTALHEIQHALSTDYFYIVINDKLEDTVRLVNSIAHDEPVEPHYHKAVVIAEEFMERIRHEMALSGTLDAGVLKEVH